MDYEIKYSDRKTISLYIKEAKLIVRAPRGVSIKRIEEMIKAHFSWIEKNIQKQKKRAEEHPPLTDEEIKARRKNAREILTRKTEYFANIMGLKYGRITITGAKGRFGSCSSKGNIAYSYRLIEYPEAAIDYVVVHELAHLLEMNHSKRFYAIIEKILPDYKERIRLLKN